MPGAVEVIDPGLVESPDAERFDELAQALAMQIVEAHPFALAASHPIHRGLVHPAPCIRERFPVGLDPEALAEPTTLADDARSPVHDCTEHIEDERFYLH